jgi:mannose-6-phosphate isomerase-like protein (cupin superfamily)
MKNTNFSHITDILIRETLEEYKEKIDNKKPSNLSISNYKVDKPWGYELWLELNEYYAYKLIYMKAGNQSSLQLHKNKYETNYVISGEAEVLLENEEGKLISEIFKVGSGWSVPIGKKHRVIAKTDYTALEVSTPHLNDVIRYEDDSNRASGKINTEHEL